MWNDPIVAETRELRAQYASQFGDDADAIFRDILQRQSVSERKVVSFQPRKPVLTPMPARQGVELGVNASALQA